MKEIGRGNAPPITDTLYNKMSIRTVCRMLLSYDFQLHRLHRFERDAVYRLALALVSHRSIDLSCGNILVTQHVLDGVDARTCIHL